MRAYNVANVPLSTDEPRVVVEGEVLLVLVVLVVVVVLLLLLVLLLVLLLLLLVVEGDRRHRNRDAAASLWDLSGASGPTHRCMRPDAVARCPSGFPRPLTSLGTHVRACRLNRATQRQCRGRLRDTHADLVSHLLDLGRAEGRTKQVGPRDLPAR